MVDEISQLRQILMVHKTSSFTRAAQALNMSQPVLSRSIAAFEARHGIRVFERGRSGAVPTTIGLSVIRDAARLLSLQRSFHDNLDLYRRGEAGEVGVGLGSLLASLVLPGLSTSLLRQRPRLKLMSVVAPAHQLYAQLMDDTLEIIFGNSALLRTRDDIVVETIGALDLAIVTRSGHPLAGKPALTVDDLEAYPRAGGSEWRISEKRHEGGGFTCDNFHIVRETVMETDCIWLSSPMFLREDIRRRRLTVLEVSDFTYTETQIGVAHRIGREMSPAAAFIRDEIKAKLAREA